MRDYVMHKIIFSLPVYQWITSVKRDNKCAFWELLYLIGTSGDRGDELPAEADTEDIPEDIEEDDKNVGSQEAMLETLAYMEHAG